MLARLLPVITLPPIFQFPLSQYVPSHKQFLPISPSLQVIFPLSTATAFAIAHRLWDEVLSLAPAILMLDDIHFLAPEDADSHMVPVVRAVEWLLKQVTQSPAVSPTFSIIPLRSEFLLSVGVNAGACICNCNIIHPHSHCTNDTVSFYTHSRTLPSNSVNALSHCTWTVWRSGITSV